MEEKQNSRSGAGRDINFIRLKENRVQNGQLKSAYSEQIGVGSEYITEIEQFSNRNDVITL